MARAPLPPVIDRAFDDDDINPDIVDVIDSIQMQRTQQNAAEEEARHSAARVRKMTWLAAMAVASVVVALWYVAG